MIDAPPPDAMPGPVFSGTISLQEVTVQGHPELGMGPVLSVDFTKNPKAPDYDDTPGSPTGCKVTTYTTAELAAELTQNEGTLTVTDTTAGSMFVIPPCKWNAGVGYLCVGTGGAGIVVTPVPMMGIAAITMTTPPAGFTPAAEVGRYLNVSGATNATNNGAFPIVAVGMAPDTLVIANPLAAAETTAGAMYITLAAAGPIPGLMEPGLIGDSDTFTFALDATGGAGDWMSFTAMVSASPATGTGDHFTLDTATQTKINAIPTDGSAFTLDCAGAGGTCGSALGTVVTITTTDTPIPAGAPSYYFPPPTAKQTSIRCAQLGASSITVTAAASAYLVKAMSGATRAQIRYLRDGLIPTSANQSTNLVVGHGVVGFTDFP
jgi:hypothetical protein